jgi:hypothetical protein
MLFGQDYVIQNAKVYSNLDNFFELNDSSNTGDLVGICFKENDTSLIFNVINNSGDTVWIFGTGFIDSVLLYSKSTIKLKAKRININLEYRIPHPATYYSGLDQYQFVKIPPWKGYSLVMDKKRVLNTGGIKSDKRHLKYEISFHYLKNVEVVRCYDQVYCIIKYNKSDYKLVNSIFK